MNLKWWALFLFVAINSADASARPEVLPAESPVTHSKSLYATLIPSGDSSRETLLVRSDDGLTATARVQFIDKKSKHEFFISVDFKNGEDYCLRISNDPRHSVTVYTLHCYPNWLKIIGAAQIESPSGALQIQTFTRPGHAPHLFSNHVSAVNARIESDGNGGFLYKETDVTETVMPVFGRPPEFLMAPFHTLGHMHVSQQASVRTLEIQYTEFSHLNAILPLLLFTDEGLWNSFQN